MPTYPPNAPTVSGDLVTISRFLNSPTLVERRLRSVTEQRFIADQLLTGRANPSGGAIQFEQSESIYTDQAVESIHPGTEFPITGLGAGPTQIAQVEKWGQDALVTLESVQRERRSPVDRAMNKIANAVVRQVDTVALAAIAAAPIQTFAGADWTAATADSILRQIAEAVAMIRGLNEGFEPDTLVIDDDRYVDLIAKQTIRDAIDNAENTGYTGSIGRLAGLRIMVSPNLPTAGTALVLDSNNLGGLADETPLQGRSWWEEVPERWRIRGKRVTVPYVNEPDAAVEITGV